MTTQTRTLWEAGGAERIRAMTEAFYARATVDPLLKPLFDGGERDHAMYLAGWFAVVFGGPRDYLEERGGLDFVIWKHAMLRISEEQRARWVALVCEAAAEVGVGAAFMGPFERFIEGVSRDVARNSHLSEAELTMLVGADPR